jgi:hypothetical protein
MTYKNPDPTSDAARTDPNTADEAREKLRTRQKKACETPEKNLRKTGRKRKMSRFKDVSARHAPIDGRILRAKTNPRVIAVLWSIYVGIAGLILIGTVVSEVR